VRRNLKPNVVIRKGLYYYRARETVEGKRKELYIRIDATLNSPEFDAIYWAIKSGKHEPKKVNTNFAALVSSYMNSRKYKDLADGTKRKYRPILEQIREKNGASDVTRIKRSDVDAIHEKYADTPRKADWYVQILSILFNHAIRLDWITSNPARTVELFGAQKAIEPWPLWFQRAYLDRATGPALTAFYVGSGTGQRAGDMVKMEWAHYHDDYMSVTQEKTKARITIYCPPKLRRFLAELPRTGKHIFARDLASGITYHTLEKHFRAVRDAIAVDVPEAAAYSLHGLRYVAAVELAEAGCTDAEIQAVTGHKTLEMVQKYRSQARQKQLSKTAQEKRK